jgi:hypothetical protein
VLASQEHFTTSLFKFLFDLAVQVAKSIGLYHLGGYSGQELQERQNLLSCLKIPGKDLCWTTGWSAGVQMHNTHSNLISNSSRDESSAYMAARVSMAWIEEQIYSHIYAYHPVIRSEEQIRQSIASLSQQLQTWRDSSGGGHRKFLTLPSLKILAED